MTLSTTKTRPLIFSKDMNKAIISFGNEITLVNNVSKHCISLGYSFEQAKHKLKEIGEDVNFPKLK